MAEELGLVSNQVIVASTGVIGVPLDMEKLRAGIPRVVADLGPAGDTAARAIMTTDNFPKTCAARFRVGETEVTIGGMTKGAGMIQPNMATTLCFVTTDAAVGAGDAAGGAAHRGRPVVQLDHRRRRHLDQRLA